MPIIDHPELMVHRSPEFKKLLPVLCQELPLEPTIVRQLEQTLGALINAMSCVDPENAEDPLLARVDECRTNLLQFWADTCIESQTMALVAHGVYTSKIDGVVFQFVKTSLTHPVRTDLVMHAFSMIATLELPPGSEVNPLLGEDCAVHYTVHNQEPKEEDVMKIAEMIQTVAAPTFDDYIKVYSA